MLAAESSKVASDSAERAGLFVNALWPYCNHDKAGLRGVESITGSSLALRVICSTEPICFS